MPQTQRSPRGFTLTELMLAISIMAMLAALAFPAITSSLRTQSLVSATQDVMGLVDFARVQAVSRNRAYRLDVNQTFGTNGRIQVFESDTVRCTGVTAAEPNRQIDFNSNAYRDVLIAAVSPAGLGTAFQICFRPDGLVVDSVNSKPIPSTDPAYGAGEARIVLQRRYPDGAVSDMPHQIVIPYSGIPHFQAGGL